MRTLVAALVCIFAPVLAQQSIAPWPETTQRIPSTCFSQFDNLYLDCGPRTFFSVSPTVNIGKSFDLKGGRKCSWAQFYTAPEGLPEPITLPGTAVLVFERHCTAGHSAHLFHFLEQLIGLWAFGGEASRDDVNRFFIVGNGGRTLSYWKGENGTTYHLIRALFPNATIQTWDDFLMEFSGQVVCFEKAITSDRSMERHKIEPYFTERMLGGYFYLVDDDAIDHLTSAVWEYCDVASPPPDRTVVTYVRRAGGRHLAAATEAELLRRIEELPHVELVTVDFAAIPFSEQIRITARTDILLGVHGNGLSHALFLPQRATLIELFPANCFKVEYRFFARWRQVAHHGWIDQSGWVTDPNLPARGNVFVNEVGTDIDAIMDLLYSILS